MRSNIIALCALAAPAVNAWGDLGHRTVAYIAEKHLTPKASALYGDLLANDQCFDISDAACWADTIKTKMPWSKGFHYINPAGDNPPTNCTVDWPNDCQSKQGCVVSAILNYTNILLTPTNPLPLRKNATMFLLHLIGDLHQPLHATGFEKGGNGVEPICWNRVPPPGKTRCTGDLNLHSVWDSRLAHKLRGLPLSLDNPREKVAAAAWAGELFEEEGGQNREGEGGCEDFGEEEGREACVLEWTVESNALVCSKVLARGVEWILEGDAAGQYYEENKGVVEEQIAKAGVRLGAWLNAIAEAIPEEGEGGKEKVLSGDL